MRRQHRTTCTHVPVLVASVTRLLGCDSIYVRCWYCREAWGPMKFEKACQCSQLISSVDWSHGHA